MCNIRLLFKLDLGNIKPVGYKAGKIYSHITRLDTRSLMFAFIQVRIEFFEVFHSVKLFAF